MIVSIMVMVLLCGCGDKKNESGNASIHSDWELVEYTINGQTENVEDDSFALKLFTADAMPAFSCPEGFRCEFSLNKKTHRGILTEEGNDTRFYRTEKTLSGGLIAAARRFFLSLHDKS